MSEKIFKGRLVQKHDTAENWAKAISFVPKQGEIIIYDIDDSYDYERFKIGDGVTNVNDLKFYAGSWNDLTDKPFGEEATYGDTLTWDGNTDGRDIVGDMFCHISDVVVTVSDCANGVIATFVDGSTQGGTATELAPGLLMLADIESVLCVATDNYDFNGMIFPKKGIYVTYGDYCVTSLTINGYTGFGSTKLKESYLPEHTHDYAASSHTHDDRYYTETEVNTKFSDMVGDTDVPTQVSTALASAKSYTDTEIANLLENSTDAVDSIYELRDAMNDNADAISALETIAGTKAAASDLTSHTSNTSNPHNVTLSQLGVTATAAELNIMDGVTATTTELNYVDGVTSNIQTQLNSKQATITGGSTTIARSNLTASRALVSDGSGKVAVSAVTSTELGYLDGVTSAIQTQLNGKAASSHTHSYLPLSGGTLTGALTCNSSVNMKSAVEIYGETPYIDFYFGNNTGDYTSRIIENSSGALSINGVKMTGSDVYADHVYIPNNCSVVLAMTNGTYVPGIFVGDANDLSVGVYASHGHTGNTYVNSYTGTVNLRNATTSLNFTNSSGDNYTGAFLPASDGQVLLGGSSHRWYKLYAASACSTSDEREKSDIMSISDYPTMYSRDSEGNVFEQLFDKLQPKTYTLDIENTDEIHIGFVAQDISKSMEELGLTEDMLGLIDHEYWTDEETGEEKDRYSLVYSEFAALNTYMIQKQKAKIQTLEERIAQLEELVGAN